MTQSVPPAASAPSGSGAGNPPVPPPFQPLTRPLPDLAAWTAHLRGMEIPVLASTAEQLEIWRANEDAVDAHLLGEILSKDPLMTLKLLAHAASQRSSRLLTDTETFTYADLARRAPHDRARHRCGPGGSRHARRVAELAVRERPADGRTLCR